MSQTTGLNAQVESGVWEVDVFDPATRDIMFDMLLLRHATTSIVN